MKHYIIDGAKSISLDQYPPEAWTNLTPTGGTGTSNREDTQAAVGLYSTVAWLYRCVELRANGVSRVPWAIMRGDTELWHSREARPPANLAYLDNIRPLLWRTEAALCLAPECFWFNEHNRARPVALRWLTPSSVLPVWDEIEGLIGFDRRIGGRAKRYEPEDMVYFPRPNPMHETEPGRPPAQAVMGAAGVIYNVDAFSAAFFERGAIKATLLTVEGNPAQEEIERLKTWWKRMFSGVKSAWETATVRAGVTPVVVGEGIQELGNTELTKEKKEEISTGMGIPHSLVMSNASNFATASQDTLNFYDMTIVPEFSIIADALNEQIFYPQGLSFQVRADEMSVFQDDETERGQAFKHYVEAGMRPSIAAQILGVDLPAGVEYADLDAGPTGDALTGPGDAAWKAKGDILGYHIESGVVTRNEARTELGLPPVDESEDQEIRKVRTKLDLMIAAKDAGLDIYTAAALVGFDSLSAKPPPLQLVDEQTITQEKARFKRWAGKRTNPEASRFDSDILTEEQKAAILYEMQEEAVTAGRVANFPEWGQYP